MTKFKEGKKKFIIILVLIVVSISVSFLLYNKSNTFKQKVGTILNGITNFKSGHPANVEKENKKACLANYYLSLETSQAADKIYIIKKNDEELFDNLIKLMNGISSGKTSEILKLVRKIEKRKDFLSSIYDEIQEERKSYIKDEAEKLESSDILVGVQNVERKAYDDKEYLENLPSVMNCMSDKKASEILFYVDDNIERNVMSKLKGKKRSDLESLILKKEIQYSELQDLGKVYESKPIEVAIEEIGNKDIYSIGELSIIYMNLSVKRAAEILARSKGDDFSEELFIAIGREEKLRKIDESETADISEAIKFIKEYDEKIDDLVKVYQKMSPRAVAKIVEDMMSRTKEVTSLEIDSSPIYKMSDSTIIVDVLRKMKKPIISKIINNMNTKKASQLTQMLTEP